ncbi:hypothetical protein KW805_04630 [Candidatus Pacearchaeota archaeon]|nr:hypothetical protein [Candidatus Pacearchaeota archaeon]
MRMIRSRENLIGAWAFLVGVLLSVGVGLFSVFAGKTVNQVILGILAILGIVAGYFVSEREAKTFLIASVSLVIVSYAGISGLVLSAAIAGIDIGKIISSTLGALLMLFVPAAVIVALKTVFSISTS